MDLKMGDIILVKGKGLISKAIEEVENCSYSHVAIYIWNSQLIEAEGFEKTGYVSVDKYKGKADVYRYNELTNNQKMKMYEYLKEQVGGHYDYLLLLWEFCRYVFHLSLPYKEKYYSHICSMLANDAYKSADINLCPKIKFASPADISESKLLRKVCSL